MSLYAPEMPFLGCPGLTVTAVGEPSSSCSSYAVALAVNELLGRMIGALDMLVQRCGQFLFPTLRLQAKQTESSRLMYRLSSTQRNKASSLARASDIPAFQLS